jgi:hypothetical protein
MEIQLNDLIFLKISSSQDIHRDAERETLIRQTEATNLVCLPLHQSTNI